MARSGDDLGTAIWTAIKATQTYTPALSGAADAEGLAIWKAFGNAFVTYDNANCEVLPNTLAITPSNIIDSTTNPCTGNGLVTSGKGKLS